MASNSTKYQYLATFSANLSSIVYGITIGWSSPSIPLLQNDSILPSGRITVEEGSWIGSIMCIGGIVGTILYGWLANFFGRKWLICTIAVPQFISFLLILLARNIYYLYVSRILGGLAGGGIFVLLPIYLSEISEDSIRGTLGACLVFGTNFGILVGFILGGYLDFYVVPYIVLAMVGIFFVTFVFFPETPHYLFMKNRIEEAEQSFRYFRGIRRKSEKIPAQLEFELQKLKSHDDKANADDSRITCNDFCVPSTRRAILISLVLMVMTQFSGQFVMINYTASIFEESGSTLSPNMSSIIVAIIQLIGSYASSVLVDRAGRKILLITSATGTGLCLTALAVFSYLKSLDIAVSSFNWLPIAALSGFVVLAAIGISTLPFVVLAEMIPGKLRGIISSSFMLIIWILAFIFVKYFVFLIEMLGMHTCMSFFAVCCYLEGMFVLLVMPETKGKSFEAIILALGGNK